MKKFREAEVQFNQALQIQVDLLGPYNKEVAATLTKLAGTYMSQGRFNEANLMKDQAMTCQVQHMQLTVDDFDPYDRAVLYHSQGAYKQAEEFYHKALAKVERNLGIDHFHLAEILTKLAELHRSLQRYDKAELLLHQALKIFQRMQHRAVLTTYAVLADLYTFQQRFEEAEDLYKQALGLIEDAIGVRQSDQLAILGGYEKMLLAAGRKPDADKIRTKLRNILKRSKNYQSIIQKPVRPESV
jgi:tetratricopeptide (TPR) repeat protein